MRAHLVRDQDERAQEEELQSEVCAGGVLQELLGPDVLPEGPIGFVAALCLNRRVGRPLHRSLRDVSGPEGVARTPFGLRQTGGLSGAFDGIADRTALVASREMYPE